MAALFTSYFHGSVDEKERQYLIIEHTKGFRKLCSNIYLSLWFEPLMMVVVILIVVKASLYIDYTTNSTMTSKMENVFRILNLVSSIVLILDLTVQIVSLKWSYYRKRWANIFFFTVTCIVIVDGISEYIVMTSHESLHSLVFSFIRLIIVFQLARAMRILKLLLYNISTVLRRMASDSLYNVYDIGRGFLFANEEVLKQMDVIVDFDPCGERPVAVCKENVVKMLKILSEFEKLYPEVTYALKSNRAARRILNRAMPVLERFKEKSIVLRDDIKELRSLLFTMKKEVVYAPKLRCIIEDVSTLLNNTFWVRNSELAGILKDNHETEQHHSGHVLQTAGDVHEYVYIIASGIVKVTGRKYDPVESSHELYNRLPNTDTFFIFEKGEGEVVEHLMKSQTIGLLGFLVGTPSETTAVCERDCQLIKVHHTFLNKIQIRNAVSYAMWRYVAIRVGAAILRQQHQYFGFPDEDIYARLENGILPELKSVTIFEVPPIVDDMVIIQGKAKDSDTHASFYGPAYVPHGFKTLMFYEDVRKRPPTIVILLISSRVQQNISRKTWVQLTDISIPAPSGEMS